MASKAKAIFICWDEVTYDPERYYIGGGEWGVRWINPRTVVRRARWSNVVSDFEIGRATAYAHDNMHDGRVNVRVEVMPD